jgi:hypothetical protein
MIKDYTKNIISVNGSSSKIWKTSGAVLARQRRLEEAAERRAAATVDGVDDGTQQQSKITKHQISKI